MNSISIYRFLIVTLLISLVSCKENDHLVTPTNGIITQKLTLASATTQLSSNADFESIVDEMARIHQSFSLKKISMKHLSKDKMISMVKKCKNEQELQRVISALSNDPNQFLNSINKIKYSLQKIEATLPLKSFSRQDRVILFQKALVENLKTSVSARALLRGPDSEAELLSKKNCTGVCNNVFYHTIESAGATLVAVAGFALAGSALTGVAGVPAASLTIAGAVVGYYIAEHYAYVALGDCFDACEAGAAI